MAAEDRDPFALPKLDDSAMGRRGFLGLAVAGAALLLSGNPVMAAIARAPERRLFLANPHTGEKFNRIYWQQGQYVPDSLKDLNYLLRDFRSNRVTAMDPRLFDSLHALRGVLDRSDPFHVISGFRTPESNAQARKLSRKVAKNSFHLYGKAIDIRVPGMSLGQVRQAALSMKSGGVGYYPRANYVHIDVGPVRSW